MAKELARVDCFTVNPFYEKLLNLRRANRKAFESISPVSKLALAEYERQKREHRGLAAIHNEGSSIDVSS